MGSIVESGLPRLPVLSVLASGLRKGVYLLRRLRVISSAVSLSSRLGSTCIFSQRDVARLRPCCLPGHLGVHWRRTGAALA